MKNLKKLRIERNLSQQKLAEKFQLSQQAIYKYENNLAEPDIQTLKNFASFFHTSIDYLVDYTPDMVSSCENASSELTPDEVHLVHLYRRLSSGARHHIIALLEEFTGEL